MGTTAIVSFVLPVMKVAAGESPLPPSTVDSRRDVLDKNICFAVLLFALLFVVIQEFIADRNTIDRTYIH